MTHATSRVPDGGGWLWEGRVVHKIAGARRGAGHDDWHHDEEAVRMRIALDPVPLVLGIYAQAGGLMHRAVSRAEDGDPKDLGSRFGQRRDESTDREVQRLVKAVHSEVKTSDKLLKKTADVWKISAESDLVELVVHRRGEGEDPRSYVLLRPDDVREILRSIRRAAEGAGEEAETLKKLDEAIAGIAGRPTDYYTFGFDPLQS
jgi:hypothetical protein